MPNPASIQNKDILQRLNFLYQASVYLTNLSQDVPPLTSMASGPMVRCYDTVPMSSILQPTADDHQTSHSSDPHKEERPPTKWKQRQQQKKEEKRANRHQIRTTVDLARAYVYTMTMVGKRTTVKMDPSVKRTLCKACNSVLIPGVSVCVRVEPSTSHKHALALKCVRCGYTRKVPAPERKGWDGRGRWDVEEEKDRDRMVVETKDIQDVDGAKGGEGGEGNGEEGEEKKTHDVAAQNEANDKKKGKRKRVHPPLPLSARRDAGHVVFRGNERVDVSMDVVRDVGDGVFAV